MANNVTILLDNVDADTISGSISPRGGSAVMNVRGELGGGSVVVQVASKNDALARYTTLANGTITEESSFRLEYLPSGMLLRVQLLGSTGATNVFVEFLQ